MKRIVTPVLVALLIVVPRAELLRAERTAPTQAQKAQWLRQLEYREDEPFDVRMTRRDPAGTVEQFRVEMPSPLKTDSTANNTIVGLYFRPAAPTGAAVIILPIAHSPRLALERIIATYLAHRGFKTFIMPMPYQQTRGRDARAANMLAVAADQDSARRLHEAAAQAVLDVKRIRQWLIREQGVDPDRVGLVGVSLGSLVASVTYSTDSSFRAAALVLGGGDLGAVIWNGSRETRRVKNALVAAGHDLEWARQLTAPLDPLTWATPQRREGLFMVNAAEDEVFPRDSTEKLRRAYGDPPILLLPGTHYTVIWYLPLILGRVATHMEGHLLAD